MALFSKHRHHSEIHPVIPADTATVPEDDLSTLEVEMKSRLLEKCGGDSIAMREVAFSTAHLTESSDI